MMKTKINQSTKKLLFSVGTILVIYAVIQILSATGNLSNLMRGLLVPICAYSIIAVGLNVCVGYLGELSLGHAGFMCIGAFSSAFFSKIVGDSMAAPLRFTLAIIIGVACAAIFGFLIAIPVLRLKGDYLAIVTLAFGEIIKNVMNVLFVGKDSQGLHISFKDKLSLGLESDGVVIVNGPQGINGTPRQATFTLGIIILIIVLIVTYNFVNSRTGRAVKAIRDNRIAAETVGLPVAKYKLVAFTLSAAIAGVAGVLYSHNLNTLTATTNNFGYNMSIMILVYVVLGGIGNFSGSVIAATILTVLPEMLRGFNNYRMLIYSVVLIILMIFNWAPPVLKWREEKGLTTASIRKRFLIKKAMNDKAADSKKEVK